MALSGVDTLTCSTLAAQLQAAQMEELGALLAELEKRFPKLARRFVVALAGYGSEASPLGLGTRPEWTELLRLGRAFGIGTFQGAVAAQFSGVALRIPAGTKGLLRSITVSAGVAAEYVVTDAAGASFVAAGAPNNLAGAFGVAQYAPLGTVIKGSELAVAGNIWKRFNAAAGQAYDIRTDGFLYLAGQGAVDMAIWSNNAVNQALDVSFEWAEPPAAWPL